MAQQIQIGDTVEWSWGTGTGTGKVTERFTERVTRTIKGSEITRNATDDEPAFLIEQDDGDRVLKSASELTPSVTGPERIDLSDVVVEGDGVQWALESSPDLNANLVHLDPGHAIDDHGNDEVDVLVVVQAGSGTATVDGEELVLTAGVVALLPRGSRRRIDSSDDGLRYLTVHRRRGPLGIGGKR